MGVGAVQSKSVARAGMVSLECPRVAGAGNQLCSLLEVSL